MSDYVDRNDVPDDYKEMLITESHHQHKIVRIDGVLRWEENPDVNYFLESLSLNDLCPLLSVLGFGKNSEVYRKLYRDMGYSLSGYWEVFYWDVNNEDCDEYIQPTEGVPEGLRARLFHGWPGCSNHDCIVTGRKKGMATNGSCPCLHNASRLQLNILKAELQNFLSGTQNPTAEKADLYGFVRWLFTEVWPHGDAEGGELQDMGVKFGILKPEEVTERCGEYCRCAEWDDFPQTCYRLSMPAAPTPEGTQ